MCLAWPYAPPTPKEAKDQKDWGECTTYALTSTLTEMLNLNYNVGIDEQNFISLVVEENKVYNKKGWECVFREFYF